MSHLIAAPSVGRTQFQTDYINSIAQRLLRGIQ